MKSFIAAARIFALINLLFLPAIGAAFVVGFLTGDRWWFSFIAIPAFFVNAFIVFRKPQRHWVWQYARRIAGYR